MEISSNYSKITEQGAYSVIFISSFLAICLEGFFIRPANYGINFIDIKIFYFIAIFNVLIFPDIFPLKFLKNHFLLLLYCITAPLLFAIYNGVLTKFISQLLPLAFFSFYYSSLILGYLSSRTMELESILILFVKIFSFMQILPLIIFFTYSLHGIEIFLTADVNNQRFNGTFSEPMNLVVIAVPSLLIAIYSQFRFKFLCILISSASIIFSYSVVGYLGLLIALIILPKSIFYKIFLVLFISPLLILILLNTSYFVKIDDLLLSLVQLSLLDSQNPSVFGLLSNLYVLIEVLKDSFLFGGGLGSHETNYYKYILPLNNINNPYWEDFVGIAAVDGNSLFIRILSDFGFVGFLLLTSILLFNYRSNWISKVCLVYLIMILARTGHYFKAEFFFFFFIYVNHHLFFLRKQLGSLIKVSR